MNYRDTRLVIDMGKVFYNVNKLKEANNNKEVKAVVKANAYGHGLGAFSYLLEKYNIVSSFCVACLDEALELRNWGIKLPILVLGAVNPSHFNICLEQNISITVFSKDFAKDVIKFNDRLKIHFKIDTAMNRIGFVDFEEFKEIYEIVKKTDLCVEGIFSHLSSADEDEEFTLSQIEKFKKFVNIMPKDIEIHLQNSAGSICHSDIDFVNAIRLGISMYGLNPTLDRQDFELKESLSLESKIVMLKNVSKNETIGYNRTYTILKDTKIATVPLGYADGFKYAYNESYAYTKVNGVVKKFPIRGKICMDQIMIEVDDSVKVGDYVTFIGEECTLLDLSRRYNVSLYEMLVSFSARLYKVYKLNGEIIYEDSQVFKNN